jgi:hypothetical protein
MFIAFYVQVTQEIGGHVLHHKKGQVTKTNPSWVFWVILSVGQENRVRPGM